MNKLKNSIQRYPILSWVLGFQLFRLILLPFMGLTPQDAYYYLYGQNLSLSYLDHPPMVGYMLRISSELLGQSVFVVKLTDFLVTSVILYTFYSLASKFLSNGKQWTALLLLCSTLFVSILSFNTTPDVPLMLFWTLSILSLYKAIFEGKKTYWILGGLFMGLAFDSKYTALLLQIGLLGYLAFSKEHRRLLLSPWLWFSLVISLFVMFPVWWWNYQNDFASFTFQSTNRTDQISEFNFQPQLVLGAIGHQLVLLLPILFWLFLVTTYKYCKPFFTKFTLPSSKELFLLAFFIPTFIGFLSISPIYWVKINWLMPSYITGVILVAMFISKRQLKWQLGLAVLFHVLIAVQVVFYIVPIKSDDTYVGWEELSKEVIALKKHYPDSFIFSADDYKTTAVLSFYLDEKVYAKNLVGQSALHFSFLDKDLSHLKEKNAIYIDSDKRFKDNNQLGNIPPHIASYFEKTKELKPIIVNPGTKKERKFWVFICENYQPKN